MLFALCILHSPSLSAQEYSKYIQAVDEFVPAPGQFTNVLPKYEEGDDAASMAAKCTVRLANNERSLVSLGAFGGYITFHFDHPVANVHGERDLYIQGNAFQGTGTGLAGGSSEPGIVMVAQDVNGNGLPDDEWYELSGSCDVDSVGKMVYGYEVTYTRTPMQDVPWTDNKGGSGTVDRNSFHTQEYFPEWIESPLTLRGTLLPTYAVDTSGKGSYWVQVFLGWGYVDNKPNADSLACSFDLDWAVTPVEREPVQLETVDFVRVYCAAQQMCGWLGETSTEIQGAEDLHLEASLQATGLVSVVSHEQAVEVARYAADGRLLTAPQRGVNIVRYSDGSVVKTYIR